jgi:hypothetical protein
MHGHARRGAERHQAERQTAPSVEPLSYQIGAVQHQRALAEKAQRSEPRGQREQVRHLAERHGGGAEQHRHRQHDAARAEAVDQAAEVAEAERGGERGERLRGRDRGARDAQISADSARRTR